MGGKLLLVADIAKVGVIGERNSLRLLRIIQVRVIKSGLTSPLPDRRRDSVGERWRSDWGLWGS